MHMGPQKEGEEQRGFGGKFLWHMLMLYNLTGRHKGGESTTQVKNHTYPN